MKYGPLIFDPVHSLVTTYRRRTDIQLSNIRSFDDLYSAFEDRFRGGQDVIEKRQSIYLPLIDLVDAQAPNGRCALDLGSGRGEWLQYIQRHGWSGTGVDTNHSMAESARAAGIETVMVDGLAFLKDCQDDAYGLITAFHVVEHITVDALIQMLAEIRRVLIPGGLLILETPNPENLTVSTWSFHMDPTHNSPIPPALLHFIVQESGLDDASILRLNSDAFDGKPGAKTALEALISSSPDYSVVALNRAVDHGQREAFSTFVTSTSQQSPADIGALSAQIERFERSSANLTQLTDTVNGITLRAANLDRGHQSLHRGYANIEGRYLDLEEKVSALEAEQGDLAELSEQLRIELDAAMRSSEASALTSRLFETRLNEVYASRSWRLTKPLRVGGKVVDRAGPSLGSIASRPKRMANLFIRHLLLYVSLRPRLQRFLATSVRRVPSLDRLLRHVFIRVGALPEMPVDGVTTGGPRGLLEGTRDFSQKVPPTMSARARFFADRLWPEDRGLQPPRVQEQRGE